MGLSDPSCSPWRGHYYLLPLLSTVSWLTTLLLLLLWWIIDDDHTRYRSSETSVVFISDIGAAHPKLFIPGAGLTWAFYAASLGAERWLRYTRRIPGALRRGETVVGVLGMLFGCAGGSALLFLSIFNAFDYPTAHWSLTLAFGASVCISSSLQTLQVFLLSRTHPDRSHLRRNFWLKLVVVFVAIVGAVAFGVTYYYEDALCNTPQDWYTGECNLVGSASASVEWLIAFLCAAYLLTLVLDLVPARKTSGHSFHSGLIYGDKSNTLHAHKDGRPGVRGGFVRRERRESVERLVVPERVYLSDEALVRDLPSRSSRGSEMSETSDIEARYRESAYY